MTPAQRALINLRILQSLLIRMAMADIPQSGRHLWSCPPICLCKIEKNDCSHRSRLFPASVNGVRLFWTEIAFYLSLLCLNTSKRFWTSFDDRIIQIDLFFFSCYFFIMVYSIGFQSVKSGKEPRHVTWGGVTWHVIVQKCVSITPLRYSSISTRLKKTTSWERKNSLPDTLKTPGIQYINLIPCFKAILKY